MNKKEQLVFVLTCGRTGTVFISDALRQCSGVTTCHERHGRILRLLQNAVGEKTNSLGSRMGAAIVRRMMKAVAIERIHFEVNLAVCSFLMPVASLFPGAIFVHIVRDPRDHVRSGVNWAEQRPLNRWFKLHVPYWAPKPPQAIIPGESPRDRLFAVATWNWYLSNKTYSGLEKINANYFCYRFEDLKADPVRFLNRMLDIAGYDNDEGRKELPSIVDMADRNASQGRFPSWPDWPDKYIQTLDKVCGPLMNGYGYGQEDEWRERLAR